MKTYVCSVKVSLDSYDGRSTRSMHNKMITIEALLEGRLFSITSDEPMPTIAQRFAVGLMGEVHEIMSAMPPGLPPDCFKLNIALLGSLCKSGHGGVGLTEYFWRYRINKNGEAVPI